MKIAQGAQEVFKVNDFKCLKHCSLIVPWFNKQNQRSQGQKFYLEGECDESRRHVPISRFFFNDKNFG